MHMQMLSRSGKPEKMYKYESNLMVSLLRIICGVEVREIPRDDDRLTASV